MSSKFATLFNVGGTVFDNEDTLNPGSSKGTIAATRPSTEASNSTVSDHEDTLNQTSSKETIVATRRSTDAHNSTASDHETMLNQTRNETASRR
ncbi:hypothetical protein GCK32_018272 [Trichostrongylus colubriformis]|uniref:Uncharacterized protein n=1 Tax=Trichostrongylus colubriformis TaxID=6319 RepID=A0AAN8F8M9_TRICO